jgi:hypothetical protein
MPDLHLSKSEIFWYGALHQRLAPLWSKPAPATTEHSATRDYLDRLFPIQKALTPNTTDPFGVIEQLAIEFGMASRIALAPAGDVSNLGPAVSDCVPPDDVSWSLADGTAVSADEWNELEESLAVARRAATARQPHDPVVDAADMGTTALRDPESLVNMMNGEAISFIADARVMAIERCGAAMGPFVAEGRAPSDPEHIYRMSWTGNTHRFHVTQQTNPFYAGLVHRFRRELKIPPLVAMSLQSEWRRLTRDHNNDVDQRPLAQWLNQHASQYQEEPEWRAAASLSYSVWAAHVCERHLQDSEHSLRQIIAVRNRLYGTSTRERIAFFCEHVHECVEERLAEFDPTKPRTDELPPEKSAILNARFAVQACRRAALATLANLEALGLPEASELCQSCATVAGDLDQAVRGAATGDTSFAGLLSLSRRLSDSLRDCTKLIFGQLYFRELAEDDVYIDAPTRARLLNEPRAIREQLAEAVSQYERRTLPNSPVTSACGLVEPIVRKLAAEWLPPGAYRGTTADILKSLLTHALNQLDIARAESDGSNALSDAEVSALLKVYRVNLAFSLHALGNSVRHHAAKILKRHDAGVMLHGLCTLLYSPTR